MFKEVLSFKKEMDKGINLDKMPIYDNVIEELDVPYLSFDGYKLSLDIFKPKTDKKKTPVAIVIHGGGFIAGSKTMEKPFSKELCAKGVLVYSISYRLLNDDNNVFDLIKDVLAGFEFVSNSLDKYKGDRENIYLISESAGGYLAIYADMLNKLDIFKKWIDYKKVNIRFKGNIFVSALFHTRRMDAPGLVYRKSLFKKEGQNKELMILMDPDNPLILRNIENAFIISSDNDFLKKYSIDFHRLLKLAHKETKLVFFEKNNELCHAFFTLKPFLNESKMALNEVLNYFDIV